jgi:signal transduction histidine kinase
VVFFVLIESAANRCRWKHNGKLIITSELLQHTATKRLGKTKTHTITLDNIATLVPTTALNNENDDTDSKSPRLHSTASSLSSSTTSLSTTTTTTTTTSTAAASTSRNNILGAVLREVRQRDGVAGRWALRLTLRHALIGAAAQHWLVFESRADMLEAQRVLADATALHASLHGSPRRVDASFVGTVSHERRLPPARAKLPTRSAAAAAAAALAGSGVDGSNVAASHHDDDDDRPGSTSPVVVRRPRSLSAAASTRIERQTAQAEVVRLLDSGNVQRMKNDA